jgi:hypothetical protein
MIDWARDDEGRPKTVKSGAYMLVKDGQIYFGIAPKDLPTVKKLITEALDTLGEERDRRT